MTPRHGGLHSYSGQIVYLLIPGNASAESWGKKERGLTRAASTKTFQSQAKLSDVVETNNPLPQ